MRQCSRAAVPLIKKAGGKPTGTPERRRAFDIIPVTALLSRRLTDTICAALRQLLMGLPLVWLSLAIARNMTEVPQAHFGFVAPPSTRKKTKSWREKKICPEYHPSVQCSKEASNHTTAHPRVPGTKPSPLLPSGGTFSSAVVVATGPNAAMRRKYRSVHRPTPDPENSPQGAAGGPKTERSWIEPGCGGWGSTVPLKS